MYRNPRYAAPSPVQKTKDQVHARIHVDRFQSRRSDTLPVKGLWRDLEIPQASPVHPKWIYKLQYKFTSSHDFSTRSKLITSISEVGLSIQLSFEIIVVIANRSLATFLLPVRPSAQERKNSETSFPRVNEDRRDLIVAARDPIKGNWSGPRALHSVQRARWMAGLVSGSLEGRLVTAPIRAYCSPRERSRFATRKRFFFVHSLSSSLPPRVCCVCVCVCVCVGVCVWVGVG